MALRDAVGFTTAVRMLATAWKRSSDLAEHHAHRTSKGSDDRGNQRWANRCKFEESRHVQRDATKVGRLSPRHKRLAQNVPGRHNVLRLGVEGRKTQWQRLEEERARNR